MITSNGNVGAASARREPQTLGWWLVAIFAPVGIIGGPVALADLFAGIIRWRGPIPYLLAFWDENIGTPFAQLLAFIASLIHLPSPTEVISDYLTLSILLISSVVRASRLIPLELEDRLAAMPLPPDIRWRLQLRDVAADLARFGRVVMLGILWPLGLLVLVGALILRLWRFVVALFDNPHRWRVTDEQERKAERWVHRATVYSLRERAANAFLTLAPFNLFLALFIANFFFS